MRGTESVGGVVLQWASHSDVGRTRTVNEDLVLASAPVFVVADGMGGHDAGDVASALAVSHFEAFSGAGVAEQSSIVAAIDEANAAIVGHSGDAASPRSMGTTVAGLVLVDNGGETNWMVFNVGDSRVYRVNGHVLQQVTVDHSYVQELVDAGAISADEARDHPHRNVVTRALGMEPGSEPDVWFLRPESGERFIVCSDGLTSEVDNDTILRTVEGRDTDDAAGMLISVALDAGGSDNVSVVVVDVHDAECSVDVDTAPRPDVSEAEPAEPAEAAEPAEPAEPAEAAEPVPDVGPAAVEDPAEGGLITGIPGSILDSTQGSEP